MVSGILAAQISYLARAGIVVAILAGSDIIEITIDRDPASIRSIASLQETK